MLRLASASLIALGVGAAGGGTDGDDVGGGGGGTAPEVGNSFLKNNSLFVCNCKKKEKLF